MIKLIAFVLLSVSCAGQQSDQVIQANTADSVVESESSMIETAKPLTPGVGTVTPSRPENAPRPAAEAFEDTPENPSSMPELEQDIPQSGDEAAVQPLSVQTCDNPEKGIYEPHRFTVKHSIYPNGDTLTEVKLVYQSQGPSVVILDTKVESTVAAGSLWIPMSEMAKGFYNFNNALARFILTINSDEAPSLMVKAIEGKTAGTLQPITSMVCNTVMVGE